MQERQAIDELTASGRRAARFWVAWGLVFSMLFAIVVLISLPPFVGPPMRVGIMQAFSHACHQIPARSPHIDGVQLAVCHRCYGIYVGLAVAALGFLVLMSWDAVINKRGKWLMLVALAVPFLDWGLGITGFWHNTPLSRLVTGFVFGSVAGYFGVRAVIEAFVENRPPDQSMDQDPVAVR